MKSVANCGLPMLKSLRAKVKGKSARKMASVAQSCTTSSRQKPEKGCIVRQSGASFSPLKRILDKDGEDVSKFTDNLPGEVWASGFLKRHKDKIKNRLCQNISRKGAKVTNETITEYFSELKKKTLDGIPPQNIINYDETYLTDAPGRKRMILKQGVKYPERILNNTKTFTSLMLAGKTDGTILPVYVVYRVRIYVEHMTRR
ncbi:hypothetical protein RRG08_043008 [Elysia crispata]|uniref:Uncharacterized protein n=1 Tax=Elysia crispata TaxID=231223 RepID=A0AAE1CP44_9GAST|nr:hypothetical protein RRG08_043008 [Elysia crispata]